MSAIEIVSQEQMSQEIQEIQAKAKSDQTMSMFEEAILDELRVKGEVTPERFTKLKFWME